MRKLHLYFCIHFSNNIIFCRDDIASFERFLQMYKRVCLQTGENVVLLTVFVNIRKAGDEEFAKDDPFKDAKNLIARYAGILNLKSSLSMTVATF